jgi:ATP-dependent Clp protease ATP-binding subunit ClpA
MTDTNDSLVGCTARVRDAFLLARAEASRLNAPAVAPAHLLLGLAWERGGVAAQALDAVGADPTRLRRALEGNPTPIPSSMDMSSPQLGLWQWLTGSWQRLWKRAARPPAIDRARPIEPADLSAEVQTALRHARAKVDQRDRQIISQLVATEDILLALLQERNDATALLEALGIRPEAARAAVFQRLDQAARGGRV